MKPSREFLDLQQALAGEYSIERELGRGGMGVVYLAREVQLDRLVAIKVLPAALAARPEVREGFLREARMAASLSHPNIVPIHRVEARGGFTFFVMSYVNGETLGERMRARGPVPPNEATRIFREVAWALSYAHGRGLVHRDIKPDNILIEKESGRALVMDFGIARMITDAAQRDATDTTARSQVMGTAHFMSPEQCAGEKLDGRSDLYSLGVVAYLTLSGKLPFDSPSSANIMAKHISEPVPSLAERAAGVPKPLVSIVSRLLEKRPENRFASGEALAESLEHAATPVRAKMPMALRIWTQTQDPLTGLYAAWAGVFGIGFLSQLRMGSRGNLDETLAIAALGSVPLVLLSIFHLRKAGEVLAAGYTIRDMRAALTAWQQERRGELVFEHERREPGWAAMARLITFLFGIGFAVALLQETSQGVVTLPKVLVPIFVFGMLISAAVSIAGGVKFLGRGMRIRAVGVVRATIWGSRFGEWVAARLTPKRAVSADLDYRPTEMAIGAAADDLFKALPEVLRAGISDLPQVVAALEAHASVARAQIGEVNALLAMGDDAAHVRQTPAELGAVRDRAEKDLANAISALEVLRLDLLRLHGGATDLRPITTALEDARLLGEELARLNKAAGEVRDVVLPFELRPHTPA